MKTHNLTKIALSVFFATTLLAGCSGKEEREAKYLQSAQEYFEQENIDKAKIEIKNVLQINPNNAKARYLLAQMDEKEQNWKGMFSNLSVAIETDPNLIEARYKLGLLYIASGELSEAKKQAEAIQKVKPNQAEFHALNAVVAQREKNSELAVKEAEAALKVDPANVPAISILVEAKTEQERNPEAAIALVAQALKSAPKDASTLKFLKIRVLEGQGKTEEVIATFKEMIADNPDQTQVVFQLAQYLASKKRYDEFEPFVRESIAAHPDDANLKILLVDFLSQIRDEKQAVAALEEYIKQDPDEFKLRDTLAVRYLKSKQTDKAKKLYMEVIDADPKSSESITARDRLISIASMENDRPKVESLLKEIFDIEPENSDALFVRAKLRMGDRDLDGAIADLRTARKVQPDSLPILLTLARAQEVRGINELALENYRAALAIQNNNYEALAGVGRLLYANGEFDKAKEALIAANKIAPENPDVIGLLGDIYVREQKWDDAMALINPLLLKNETAALGFYFKARLLAAKKDAAGAQEALEQSLAKKASPDALRDLITLLASQNKIDKANTALDNFIKENPKAEYALELKGNLYAASGKPQKAQEIYEALLAKNPDQVGLYPKLIQVYLGSGKSSQDIIKLIDNGLAKTKKKDELLMMKAEYLQVSGKPLDALAIYEELLAKNPKSQLIQNNIAALILDYAPTKENLEKAQKLTVDLVSSERPELLDTVGWLQYKLGNYPQALSLLQDARKKGSKGPVYDYHLGMAYYQSNNKAKAKELLEAALANEKATFVGKDEAKTILAELSK